MLIRRFTPYLFLLLYLALNSFTPPVQAQDTGTKLREPVSTENAAAGDPSKYELNLSLISEVVELLKDEYVDPSKIDNTLLTYGAIAGIVNGLGDSHTFFMPPQRAKKRAAEQNETGYVGIGVTISRQGNSIVVESVEEDGPAGEGKLFPGDFILKVRRDGDTTWHSLVGVTTEESAALIKGPENSGITLSVIRAGMRQPIEVRLVRRKIERRIFRFYKLKGNISYIRLYRFASGMNVEFDKFLKETSSKLPSGVILDLRNNPGGLLNETIEFMGNFLPQDTTAVIIKNRNREMHLKTLWVPGLLSEVPLVILVNENSASASEIFAGALKFHRKTPLIGEKTYGKGSVQTEHTFSDGSVIHYTVDYWLTPDEQAINGKGIDADINIPFNWRDVVAGRIVPGKPGKDPQLDAAIKYLEKAKKAK